MKLLLIYEQHITSIAYVCMLQLAERKIQIELSFEKLREFTEKLRKFCKR